MNFKQILSYLVPIKIYETKSEVNKNLEIAWNNGKLVLDSKNTNFSYGNLQKVLRFGLKKIGFDKIRHFDTILVLGVAGGSVIKTLVDEIQFKGKITGIEIDAETIRLANHYFGLNAIANLEIIIADAEKFVATTTETYDLIIIDIFQDDSMPDFLFDNSFLFAIQGIMKKEGVVLFNTIATNAVAKSRNDKFAQMVSSSKLAVARIPNLEGDNELLIIKRL